MRVSSSARAAASSLQGWSCPGACMGTGRRELRVAGAVRPRKVLARRPAGLRVWFDEKNFKEGEITLVRRAFEDAGGPPVRAACSRACLPWAPRHWQGASPGRELGCAVGAQVGMESCLCLAPHGGQPAGQPTALYRLIIMHRWWGAAGRRGARGWAGQALTGGQGAGLRGPGPLGCAVDGAHACQARGALPGSMAEDERRARPGRHLQEGAGPQPPPRSSLHLTLPPALGGRL